MNQTRTFLIFAWLMVATLLFVAWTRDHAPAPQDAAAPTAPVPSATVSGGDSTVPTMESAVAPAIPSSATVAADIPAGTTAQATTPTQSADTVTVGTDVLDVSMDGGAVRQVDLLAYPQAKQAGSPPVRFFSADPAHFYQAQSGWVSDTNTAPSHENTFVPVTQARDFTLRAGQESLQVPFVWQGPDGVSIHRTYTFTRGSYAVQVRDQVVNAGSQPWQGFIYRQLVRVPPQVKTGFTHPESYSFHGATWFGGDSYDRRKFDDFTGDGPLDKQVTGGWVAMLQHHFFAAWIPGAKDASTFSLVSHNGAGGHQQYLIRELGPGVKVAPGGNATTTARLWVGPKLVNQIQKQKVPGLERAVDFSRFSALAWIAGILFSVLSFLHSLFGNWGWSIVGLVVIIKALMYPLSAVQYKSAAKMRRFQPRIEQLKERYGEDKQKFQMAMMELYKKEKINPVGGCFPVLLQMPIFLALYYTLLESVELRQAPWIGWIQNLTAPDPYFILPVINIAVMWATQKLTPSPGMDPMQKKMMQIMPLAMGVMFAFFPAGLVLYWVTNGSLGLLQQWWMTKRHGQPIPTKA